MAALALDEQTIPVCIGCTMMLEFCGLLARRCENETNNVLFVLYELKAPNTLADCQRIVDDRHKGNAGERWGEMPRGAR
jgi:hypothetical protein